MARLYGQAPQYVLSTSNTNTAVGSSASISGSMASVGYAYLVGAFYSNASAAVGTASGLKIMQSVDGGNNWDLTSASYQVTASTASGIQLPIYGNAVKVQFWNGATAASLVRYDFWLRAV